jgi:predicted RNA-binding protein with PUA-like domain
MSGSNRGGKAPMAYWLVKSEPGTWSWDDQVRDGTTHWDGVRNYQASNNLKAMKKGDRCFFYHSVNEKQIVGIVEVVKEYYPDPSDPKGRFGMVDVKAVKPFKRPVTLAEIKDEPRLEEMALIRQSRLSVMPVSEEQWNLILAMGETKP